MAPRKFQTGYFSFFPVLAAFLGVSLFAACGSNTSSTVSNASPPGSAATSLIYPMYIDSNVNGVNDYFEEATHDPGSSARVFGMGSYGHNFVDIDIDGVCDYAQNGSSTWHGPGYVDENGNGMSDYWDASSMNYYNMGGGMQYMDANGNDINDYMEGETHLGYGHDFVDANSDGVCDYAQSGGIGIWHGPGYVDDDGNGLYDHWEVGHNGNGGMMGSFGSEMTGGSGGGMT
ncbi:MAG TPA: hypothetical protein ENI77_08475 [Nitrospirae bacterium]|nr:hypothetical protein [Nitrospirota bacterium]